MFFFVFCFLGRFFLFLAVCRLAYLLRGGRAMCMPNGSDRAELSTLPMARMSQAQCSSRADMSQVAVASSHVARRHGASRHTASGHVASGHVASGDVASRHAASRHVASGHGASRRAAVNIVAHGLQSPSRNRFEPTNTALPWRCRCKNCCTWVAIPNHKQV